MPQTILAIETSQQSCSVAIRTENGVQSRHQIAAKQHANVLLPMVNELLTTCSVSLQDVDAIAFGCGPGSFTGARIAASVTQGLAFAANARVIPVSSLQALAHSYLQHHSQLGRAPLLVVLDAHMDEYYAACYQFNAKGDLQHTFMSDCLLSATSLRKWLSDFDEAVLLGNGLPVLLEKSASSLSENLLRRLELVDETARSTEINANSVLAIAENAWREGEHLAAEQALPVYLRERSAWKTVEQQTASKSESK